MHVKQVATRTRNGQLESNDDNLLLLLKTNFFVAAKPITRRNNANGPVCSVVTQFASIVLCKHVTTIIFGIRFSQKLQYRPIDSQMLLAALDSYC